MSQQRKKVAQKQSLRQVPKGKKGKGLSKLPTAVRNKMGFMKNGGAVKSAIARGCGQVQENRRKKTKYF